MLAVVFQVGDVSSRKPTLNVLLWQRAMDPQRGRWALPGGRLSDEEDLTSNTARERNMVFEGYVYVSPSASDATKRSASGLS